MKNGSESFELIRSSRRLFALKFHGYNTVYYTAYSPSAVFFDSPVDEIISCIRSITSRNHVFSVPVIVNLRSGSFMSKIIYTSAHQSKSSVETTIVGTETFIAITQMPLSKHVGIIARILIYVQNSPSSAASTNTFFK